ncbi:glutathione S-transferase [Cladophialophora carrionii]|uniref:Glutathione S-transferase n=1 Tax=Cladophialophora carrionii TaxID=86049 RepID=A0A1C1CL53_9EURO|nr:glutathione S-transferase [Cladophialophora carrionii]
MGSVSEPPVVLFDYQFAPNAQKARNLLSMCGIPFKVCEQPFVMPRPVLADLGITYRRIPVNAIGRDLYADNHVFLEAVQSAFPEKAAALAKSPADHAYEAFGYRTFWICLPLVPEKLMSEEFLKDRAELFSVFNRPDYKQLRPSALAEFRQTLDLVEKDFLAQGPWIGGEKCSIADIHASWMIKFVLQTLDVKNEPGFSERDFPKVHAWVNGLPLHTAENDAEKISADEAKQAILSSAYAAKDTGIDSADPTGLQAGVRVVVGTTDDATPGGRPQEGKLVGLSRNEVVIELENGIRMHFPRLGFVVKKA